MGNFVSNYRFRMREIALDSFPMKEGGCKESFTAWRNSPTEKNYVMMMNCMKAHREYYQPVIAPAEASGEKFKEELEAFFMPSKEDLKLPEEEREEELLMRVFEFMKGGPCKEIFTAFEDCLVVEFDQEDKEFIKCLEVKKMMWKCTKANSDYYQPFLMAQKAAGEECRKELSKLYLSSKLTSD